MQRALCWANIGPVSGDREELLRHVANQLASAPSLCIAVDGCHGAGMRSFASDLAKVFRKQHRTVIRASVDDFLNEPHIRHRRGRHSAEGFWLDAYNYSRFLDELLIPFGKGPRYLFRRAIYNPRVEKEMTSPWERVQENSVLIIDGIFLLRDELYEHWDLAVYLDAPVATCARRVVEELQVQQNTSPFGRDYKRRLAAHDIYTASCRPRRRADIVIDHSDLEHPTLLDGVDSRSPTAAAVNS